MAEQLEMTSPDESGEEQAAAAEKDAAAEKQKADEIAELRAALAAGREELAELRGMLTATKQAPVKEEPRDLTRDELRAMVDRGDITEDQMFERYMAQERRKILTEANANLEAKLASKQGERAIREEIDKYDAKIEGLRVPGHANRAKAEAEYKRLIRAGFPDNVQTEITALRGVFGPADQPVAERRRLADTHQEGGATASGDAGERAEGGKGLDPRFRAHYQKGIDSGRYKGWDDPALKAELKHMRSAKRAEARVH